MSDLLYCGRRLDDMTKEELIAALEHMHKLYENVLSRERSFYTGIDLMRVTRDEPMPKTWEDVSWRRSGEPLFFWD